METNKQNTICRICMQNGINLFPIFNEVFFGDNTITIAEIIAECTRYPVAHNDRLPEQICNVCMKAARNAHNFKRQAEQAYCQLKALYDITWIPKRGKSCDGSADDSMRSSTTEKYTQTEKSTVFLCESCPKKFFNESEIKQHRATEHIYDGNKCRVCGEKFNHLGQLKVHLSTEHPGEGIRCDFKCDICSRGFTRKDHMKRHLRMVHKVADDKPKIFSNYSSHWADYEEDDGDVEKRAIDESTKETLAATNPFSSEDEGLNHNNFNEMDEEEEDIKRFVETISHQEIAIKDEPNDIMDAYSYDDMDDSKNEPESILPEEDDDDEEDEYMLKDDDDDDYDSQYFNPPKIIPTKESSNTNFNQKYQRNPVTNMFHCVECLLEFKLQRNLVRHMLTHTDDRPFTCNLCLKTFKRKDNLQKHLRDVHSEKLFACDKCDKKFATHRQLFRHNQTSRHIKTK